MEGKGEGMDIVVILPPGLPYLTSLHLGHNQLRDLPDLHTRLGQVGRWWTGCGHVVGRW